MLSEYELIMGCTVVVRGDKRSCTAYYAQGRTVAIGIGGAEIPEHGHAPLTKIVLVATMQTTKYYVYSYTYIQYGAD